MNNVAVDPQQYIELVRARAGLGADPLALVDVAAGASRDLASAADTVLEHFVRAAHHDGSSWTLIGKRLGMTRQAARQRFGIGAMRVLDDVELEVMPRLQACLDRARNVAEQDGRDEVDTAYLLLGLLHVGVAAAALDRLGITRDRLRDAIGTYVSVPAGTSPARTPVFSDEARQAIDGALAVARECGHCYVGTEHLLVRLASDPGSAARRVFNRLDIDASEVRRELGGLVPLRSRGPRRRKRGPKCSFCGRSASPTARLVKGSGICICSGCIHQAAETLAQRAR